MLAVKGIVTLEFGERMIVNRHLVLVLLTVLTACSAAQMPTPLTELARLNAATNAFASETTLVIRDEPSWQALWSRMNADRSPASPLPAVDFAKDTVLVAAAGTRPTGGFSVAITDAAESGGEVIVKATITSPGPGCIVTQALTSPVHVASIPRRDGPVKFQLKREVHNCTS